MARRTKPTTSGPAEPSPASGPIDSNPENSQTIPTNGGKRKNPSRIETTLQPGQPMLSRMIDRAGDFCKYSSDTDYRAIVKEDPLIGYDSFFNAQDEKTP